MKNKEEIYLNLAKLSEEEQKEVIAMLPKRNENYRYGIDEIFYILTLSNDGWYVGSKVFKNKQTEVNLQEFKEILGVETSAENARVEDGWIEVNNELPTCTSIGNWDGKQSEIILAETMTGKKFLAQCYEGFMDGVKFFDWYQVDEINSNEWIINESVSRWMNIPF